MAEIFSAAFTGDIIEINLREREKEIKQQDQFEFYADDKSEEPVTPIVIGENSIKIAGRLQNNLEMDAE